MSASRTYAPPASVAEFIEQIKSPDADVRFAAWRAAGPMGAPAVAALGELAASTDKGVARAANGALRHITHYAARAGAAPEARAVAEQLAKVGASNLPRRVRADALHLAGFAGDAHVVPDIARLLDDPVIRDEARMALERIPGSAALNGLRTALRTAPEDFKPALEQSLRARRLTRKSVGL